MGEIDEVFTYVITDDLLSAFPRRVKSAGIAAIVSLSKLSRRISENYPVGGSALHLMTYQQSWFLANIDKPDNECWQSDFMTISAS